MCLRRDVSCASGRQAGHPCEDGVPDEERDARDEGGGAEGGRKHGHAEAVRPKREVVDEAGQAAAAEEARRVGVDAAGQLKELYTYVCSREIRLYNLIRTYMAHYKFITNLLRMGNKTYISMRIRHIL